MIGKEEHPLQTALGPELGAMMSMVHKKWGVNLHMKNKVAEILKDKDGNVESVKLEDGTIIEADCVIVGAGVSPATKFLERTDNGIKVDARGAVVCDPFLQTSNKDIFAAGDVASFPFWMTGKQVRIEHWVNALEQGETVAHSM